MSPERWQQIEELFNSALEVDAAERTAFIDQHVNGDDELRAEVERLLNQFDEADSFISQPLFGGTKVSVLSSLLDESDEDPMVGKVLGNYRIEREIGRGGMGAVYEAVRADGEFRLRVALKVVKRGVDTDFVLRRFRNERQILAALEHPFITRLIDGGTTDDGRPYFVMEYIDGLPLYRYCDRQRLSVEDRLKLFCRVCEAVEYAHQKLVIHRDLKPSNIFITNDGTPRLLDFGIAKLLDPEMAVDTLRPTATALRMMTVDYASPEQIRGEQVTYATDVYSLGVVLFELLTGFRPYGSTSRSPHDVAKAICDDEPVLPSDAVSDGKAVLAPVPVNRNATTLTDIAGLRRESPSELRSQLRGDLDNIICKAIEKSTSDRYESVALFRTDIERHLNGEDISVHRTFTPPLKAAIRDAGVETRLVAVLPLSLMGPSGAGNTDEAYLTIGLADAIITRLASVRKLTVRPTSSITRYNEREVNPFRAGKELGVDFVLDGRIRRSGDRLRISLQLLDVNNGSAIWAGQFDEHLTDVLELEDAISEQVAAALIPQLTGEDREKLAKRGTNDPRAYEAYLRGRFYWNQFSSQSLPKALEAYQAAIKIDPRYALAHSAIADFYIWANIYGLIPVAESFEKSEISVHKALEIDKELGEAYATMALLSANRFQYERAEALYKKSVQLVPNYSQAHEWYAALLIGTGRFDEGRRESLRTLELDPMSLRTKILVIWNLYQLGDYETALAMSDEVVELDKNYPQGHLQRGYTLMELGKPEEAVASLQEANKLMPGSSLAEYSLCFAYAAAGRVSDAVALADSIEERSKKEYVKPMFLFFANVAAGRMDKAYVYLEQGVDECDAWLVWLPTEVKLKSLRNEPRFLDALVGTRRELVDGKVRIIGEVSPDDTSVGYVDNDTFPVDQSTTSSFVGGFFRRHAYGFVAAAILIVGVVIAYSTGFLTFSFNRQSQMVLRPIDPYVRSIAVLPFGNSTGDPSNDYISDGMGESLIGSLTRLPDISVVPKPSLIKFKDSGLDPAEIGKQLRAENIVTGNLTMEENEYKLQVEMTRVTDGKKIFSATIHEKPERIFALQEMLNSKIVEALDLKSPAPATEKKSYTANNEAFQHYLKGEFDRQKGAPSTSASAIDEYHKAIAADPNYALAYQGLALAYRSAPAYGAMTPQEAFPKAKEAALKALALDPTLSTANVALASIKSTYDWDFAGAEDEYKRAIQSAPNNAEARYSYGNFLVAMGRTEEALREYQSALQIDPLSLNIQTNIGWAKYIAGNYDEALAQVRQVIDRDPTFARAYLNLGEILLEQGKPTEAIRAYKNIKELSQDPLADMALGHAYAISGQRAEAEKIVSDLEERVRRNEVSSFLPAVVYAGMNDKDKAFYWLERAYQERSNWLTLLKVGRRLKSLRGDPRYDDLVKRIGFPN